MKVVARRREGYSHAIEVEGGHTLLVDEPASDGGTDTGPSPTRLVAGCLAGCVAITMEMYGERKGWDLGALEVEVDVAYRDYMPISYEVRLRLPADLDDEQRERLLRVARKCPVHRLLAHETEVAVSDEIEAL
jgi:putative redox protein